MLLYISVSVVSCSANMILTVVVIVAVPKTSILLKNKNLEQQSANMKKAILLAFEQRNLQYITKVIGRTSNACTRYS